MMIEQGRDESMQETAEAIAQLVTATASDRSTVETLTITNAKLPNQLEAAHALIAQLKSEITTLTIKIKPVYQVAKSHTSATWNVRKTGHQENTTRIDTMGGVQWGKE
jgi:predicted RNase H-like nuclease (RuvC/YqgF family)